MKLLPIVAAALLALPAEADEQPKMTFAEGVCAGVVLGLATGITIVVAIRCWQKPPPLVQSTNAPGWTVLPPAGTNSPPPGTNVTATIDAGQAVEHVDLSSLGIGFDEGMRFIVETSDNAIDFAPLYEVRIWQNKEGFTYAGAYSLEGELITPLPVPMPYEPKKFFRVRHP